MLSLWGFWSGGLARVRLDGLWSYGLALSACLYALCRSGVAATDVCKA